MRFTITKEVFLKSMCFDKLLTRESYNQKIEGCKKFEVLKLESGEEYPNYDEYVEFYAEEGFDFCEYYKEQTKQLGEFQKWLKDNKNKTFTYDEINQKLLELKLSFDGFNGDLKIKEN
jgi:hypothetical protein